MARILVAEDDDAIRGLVVRALSDDGHDLTAAADGSEALDVLSAKNGEFDLLLTDVKMPGLDGLDLAFATGLGHPQIAIMLMTGDPIDARQALAWGLVSELLSPEALLPRALELAETIASRAPIAVETAKANLAAAANMPMEQAVTYERDIQTVCFATADAAEGRAAFAEKRAPRFVRA